MDYQRIRCMTVASLLLAAVGVRADAVAVPSAWNQSPWQNGAAFEAFNDDAAPAWAQSDSELKADATTAPNVRFWATEIALGKQLFFATEGISYALSNANFSTLDPLFVDMMCKFTLMEETPAAAEGTYVLRAYVTPEKKLVVQTPAETQTADSATIDPNTYYRLTIQLQADNYIVKVNDGTVATLTVKAADTKPTKIEQVVFSGSGYVDDLYVGHGDPSRTVAYIEKTLNAEALAGATDSEANAVNNWLVANSQTSLPAAQAVASYLVNATVTEDAPAELLISDFDVDTAAKKVTVKVYLTVGGTAKSGAINGCVQLYGAATSDGQWAALEAKTPAMTEFTDGFTAEYTFDVNTDTYKFFKPVIVTE
ncbi:MAG: hypothetical protein J6334_06420 [Kiritimatiellae bacterium]|nr:hypothetical protein [Kiritimatiellia bacterium]